MSRSVILLTDEAFSLRDVAAALRERWWTHKSDEVRVVVQPNGPLSAPYVRIARDSDPADAYEEEELRAISINNPTIYLVDFDSLRFLKTVLPVIANYPQLWVDNDDGDIMWGPAVVSRLAAEPAWTLGVPTTTGD